MHFTDMTLPMVTCPLCCRPGFTTSDSLCSALVDVTTRKLCCPICNHTVIGLDKFTIHLFSHSLNKYGLDNEKECIQICEVDDAVSSSANIKSNSANDTAMDVDYNNTIFKLQSPSNVKVGPEESYNKSTEKQNWRINNSGLETQKSLNIPDSSLICIRTDNGQLFALSPECLGSSLKNVTINTQNYITNTNITTSTVQTSVIEKVQKRKYSQVFESDNSDNTNKNIEVNSPDNYSNIESVNSWPSTPSVSSDADKTNNNSLEREFESCKDLLTKGDFSTLSDEIGELNIKRESSLSDSLISDEINDDADDKKDDDRKKERLSCELCPFVFPNKTILAMHKQLIHKKVEVEIENKRKLLICSMCPRTFSLRSSLMIHRKVAHAGGFGTNENGTQPKQQVTKPACHICGKFFKKEIHLAQHMKAHDEKQWQCTICSKTFTTKYFLKKHRRLHTGETPYKCNKCGKAFTFQQSYHKHLLYHNDEKPYCCAQCGRLFKELSTLHNHERIHSGEKPFSCETCGKAFRQRVSYLVHRRIHTGAMPYKCTACNKSFRYKISQRTHKCPVQPPGVVVRTSGSLVERLQAAMTKAAEEIDRNILMEKSDSVKANLVNKDTTEEQERRSLVSSSGADGNPSSSNSASTIQSSTLVEKTSPENSLPTNSELDKIQIDKPQIYLLVKGPNEETYYQPLIISPTVSVTGDQKSSTFVANQIVYPTSFQPNTKDAPLTNVIIKAINTNSKDVSDQSSTDGNATSPTTKKCVKNPKENIKQLPKKQDSETRKTKLSDKTAYNSKVNCVNDELIHDNVEWFQTDNCLQKDSNTSQLEEGYTTQNKPPDEAIVTQILNTLNCDELIVSKSNKNSCDEPINSLNNHKLESTPDLVMMEPPDIFSFILSPSLSSPSDRLEKLSLSPNTTTNTHLGIDNFDTAGVFNGNTNSTNENHQDSLFDTISDDALKEFLFGSSN